ncbi:MAG: GntR family transcriptional regulator [Microbacteriaceae bacterium]|nr:GntR family transcriptional regulator [Microbacteriaceae bacterium]
MSSPRLNAVQRQAAPLRRMVVDEIRRAIVTNVYPAGTRLVERVLCEELGVSRSVLRESLRQLESEKIIDLVPHVGIVVHRPTREEVRSLYSVRGALESLAAAECARNASEDALAKLRAALAAIPGPDADPLERIEAQNRFMALVVEGSGNVVLWEILETLRSRLSRIRAHTIGTHGPDRVIPGMTSLLEAIEARDADLAEQRAREFVARALDIALDVIDEL